MSLISSNLLRAVHTALLGIDKVGQVGLPSSFRLFLGGGQSRAP